MNIDDEIVSGILAGKNSACEKLIAEYGKLIRAVVIYHLRIFPELWDDCTQEILLSVWQNIDKYDKEKNSLKNWIGVVSKYKCIDFRRKYSRDQWDELSDQVCIPFAEFESETQSDIDSILKYLPDCDKELFYRHYILGEKVNEIAKACDKPPAVLYNRLSRGRKKLKKIYARRF